MAFASSPTAARAAAHAAVRVRAPARLHLGFIDPGASLGRRYGSVGLVLDAPATVLELARADADRIVVPPGCDESARIARHLGTLRRATGCDAPLAATLAEALPAHAGLGSGTQLAIALGRAFAALHGLALGTREVVGLLGRGLRSGIGIAGFDDGGFLVDAGPAADGAPAPVLFRAALPAAWRVLLVQDPTQGGLHGDDERRAIAALPPFPREHAAEISHELLMRVLPAVLEADFERFARGITTIQQRIGAHFAPAQGGSAFTSAAVGRLVEWVGERCGAGIGQSSWGPTGFALLPSAQAADEALAAARSAGVVDARLKLAVVAARNRGAVVEHTRAAGR